METVSNITSAATRAIWGDSTKTNETAGQEPVSGEVGNTANGEPYDAGNAEPATSTSTSKTTDLESSKPTDTEPASTSTTIPQTSAPSGNTPATSAIRPEHDTDKTGVTSIHNPTSTTSSDKPTSSNDTSGPGATPSVSADPSSGTALSQKQQGADRPHETPSSEESDRIAATKKEAEEAANVDTSGPGPVPLEQKAKEGGGKVGKGEEDDEVQKESTGEGTGEQYVKSSGMVADGGDFDASNPGAGREADRLLEEKGVKRTEAPPKDTPEPAAAAEKSTATATPETEETKKKSLKEKIKEKLHKH